MQEYVVAVFLFGFTLKLLDFFFFFTELGEKEKRDQNLLNVKKAPDRSAKIVFILFSSCGYRTGDRKRESRKTEGQ